MGQSLRIQCLVFLESHFFSRKSMIQKSQKIRCLYFWLHPKVLIITAFTKRMKNTGNSQYYQSNHQQKMKNDELLQINHSLTSLNPEIPETENKQIPSTVYYKAIRDLKDVNQKIASIKTRINNLVLKHNKTNSRNFTDDTLMTFRHDFFKQEAKGECERMQLHKIKANSEAQLKKISVWNKRQQIVRGVQNARNYTTQIKFNSHDLIKEISIDNLRRIQTNNEKIFMKNQRRHDILYKRQKSHGKIKQHIQEKKQKEVRQFCSLQTKLVHLKIQQKRRQLSKIEEECQKYQKKIRSITEKNNKKIRSLKKNLERLTSLSLNSYIKQTLSPLSNIKLATIS